jgi:hypothetical protein
VYCRQPEIHREDLKSFPGDTTLQYSFRRKYFRTVLTGIPSEVQDAAGDEELSYTAIRG